MIQSFRRRLSQSRPGQALKVCMVFYGVYHADARVQSYTNALAEVGAQVDVVCPRSRGSSETRPRPGIRIMTVPTPRVFGGNLSSVLSWILTFILITFKLSAMSLSTRYDVIHVHNMPNLLIFTALLPRLLGAKLILDIHDLMPEVYMSRHGCGRNHLVVRLLRFEEMISVGFAQAVITACDSFRVILEQRSIGPNQVTVVYNVPDPSIFRRDLALDGAGKGTAFTMLYPGTISTRYCLSVAIRALPILAEKIGRVRLLLIGPFTPYVTELLNLADQLDVSTLLEYRGGMPLDEVAAAVSQADVGIYTSLPDAHMSIAVPGKVLEYAVMGVPIVSSRLKVLESMFPPSALMFFEPGDEQQFADCIVKLFENPERRAELVRSMDEGYVQTHTWRNEMGIYFELLNRLLAGKACAGFVNAGPPERLETAPNGRTASLGESL